MFKVTNYDKLRIEGAAGLVFSTLFMIALLILWDDAAFIKPEFEQILPVMIASIAIGIAASSVMIFQPYPSLKLAHDAVNFVFILVIGNFFLQEYPFDFASIGVPVLDQIMPWVFLLVIVASGIGLVVDLFKFSLNGDS